MPRVFAIKHEPVANPTQHQQKASRNMNGTVDIADTGLELASCIPVYLESPL